MAMNRPKNLFANQVAVVTGASRGIGREIALTLARLGAHVVINYHQNHAAAHQVVESIQTHEVRSMAIQADVSIPEEASHVIHSAHRSFKHIDLLVHNVGPFTLRTLAETSIEEWHHTLNTNLHSAFYCVHSVLPVMRKQGQGHIVFIGSIKADSTRARPNACAYGIAKTGLVLLAKTIAREEGPNGIRANVVNPGVMAQDSSHDTENEPLRTQVPLKRLGTPSDIASAIVYLHSQDGQYCNGCTLNVDGGLWL